MTTVNKDRMIKSPTGPNLFSGKVSTTYIELATVEVGVTKLVVLDKGNSSRPVIVSIVIEQWMIDGIEEKIGPRGPYLLMPYAKKFKPASAA